ncbi:anthranilate synthase component I family protein [Kordia sp.]|uniref:anthranilate synthase component I family protein n=1 Tax=Kordia sp. TaxID=1965332 RepID=UPI0025BA95D6|nr:anthranilate synthase component I family protein [Kordia sp.]MCH2193485.1 anthranilate synthase component I family protein [Kordia sp.]
MRVTLKFSPENPSILKQQLLLWSQQFYEVVWLDSNDYKTNYGDIDAILAVDALTLLQTDYINAFQKLEEYQKTTNDWIFGYLSYDLKNDVEHLVSQNFDGLHFPELYFFQPKKIFILKGNILEVHYLQMVSDELQQDIQTITNTEIDQQVFQHEDSNKEHRPKIKLRIHKDEYHEKVNKLLGHIHRGDIYEANFCQEFYAENAEIDPFSTYTHLNAISKPPFATYMRLADKYILSASPERYIKKEGTTIISQPIKGTAKRVDDSVKDQEMAENLRKDEKERAENIMIVDLVRNDLSKTAIKGSVKVTELCKIYTFDQVHQMISTIMSEVAETQNPIEILKTTFPMGSMTGAPKISAMNITENLEETKRGIYSGAIGYFTPNNDFDFNVVIRSILYNSTEKYVSYSVGGAITAKSVPEKEYEECLIKAKAMREALES